MVVVEVPNVMFAGSGCPEVPGEGYRGGKLTEPGLASLCFPGVYPIEKRM